MARFEQVISKPVELTAAKMSDHEDVIEIAKWIATHCGIGRLADIEMSFSSPMTMVSISYLTPGVVGTEATINFHLGDWIVIKDRKPEVYSDSKFRDYFELRDVRP